MSGVGSLGLQKGMVTALRANTALTTLLASLRPTASDSGIYDAVPQGAVLPYIVVGEGSEIDAPTFGKAGHEVLAAVECWSADGETTTATTGAAGYRQALSIADLAVTCIFGDSITVTGYDVCVYRLESMEKQRNDDAPPYLRVVIPTFAVLLEES